MLADQGDECLEQIRELLRDPVKKHAFVNAFRERRGWVHSTYRRCLARVDQMLVVEDPHFFPVEAQADVIRIVGHAGFLDPLLALEAKCLRQKRREAQEIVEIVVGRDRRVA
jgi:hypothetical protein